MHRTIFGIVALAFASSLPVIIHGAVSAHLDLLIYCLSALMLYVSIRTFGSAQISKPGLSMIPVLVTAAMLVKFSRFLSRFIPVGIVVLFRRSLKDAVAALVLEMAGLALVSPCYHQRYVIPTGAIFPSANDWWYSGELAAAKAARDENRLGWLLTLVAPSPVVEPNAHCLTGIHLSDAWRDL